MTFLICILICSILPETFCPASFQVIGIIFCRFVAFYWGWFVVDEVVLGFNSEIELDLGFLVFVL